MYMRAALYKRQLYQIAFVFSSTTTRIDIQAREEQFLLPIYLTSALRLKITIFIDVQRY